MAESANNAPISNQPAAEEERRAAVNEDRRPTATPADHIYTAGLLSLFFPVGNDHRSPATSTPSATLLCCITEHRPQSQWHLRLRQAAAQALVLAAAAYAYAKQGAGPLRPGVDHVEGTVKAVVGPVYDRFHAVPLDLLKFLDRKVGESVQVLDRRVPPVVKEARTLARSAATEVRQTGIVGTAAGLAKSAMVRAEPKARGLYTRYEPMAERRAAEAWAALNRLPLVPSVTRAVLPTVAQLSARYNSVVCDGTKRGNTVATYLPLVPTERFAKVFGYPLADSAPAAAPEMQPIPSQ